MNAKACNALLVYPRADTFWNFKRTAAVFGAKYPAPPLGLITVAALLPRSWSIRLVNRNTEELSDGDLDWADLIFTGGMLPQQSDTLDVVDFCHARGKPVVVGGPELATLSHWHVKRLTAMHNIGQIDREISRSRETTDRDGEGASDDHQT